MLRAITIVACLLIALITNYSSAQSYKSSNPLIETPAEQEALKDMRAGKLIRAREKSEKILISHPDSILARYVLSQVFLFEEGNLPRALFHIRKVSKQLTSLFGKNPTDELARQWYRKFLMAEEMILGEMDRREEQLAVLNLYDGIFEPQIDQRRVWPLMKLHRFEEAIKIAKKATLSSDEDIRISGYNGLLSVEFERQRPQDCFKVAMEAVRATSFKSCVLNFNTAEAAFTVFKFDKAERLSQLSIQAPLKDCPSSAHTHLANLYLLRSDFQKAIAAVIASREEGVPKRYRQQFEMTNTAWLMRLLYALGKFDQALDAAQNVVRSPDRVGLVSFSANVMLAIFTIGLHSAITARIEQLKEEASARTITDAAKIWIQIQLMKLKAWKIRKSAGPLLTDDDTLISLIRPYIKPIPPWHSLDLISVAGEGIVTSAIKKAQTLVQNKKRTAPYFNAFLAENAFLRSDFESALNLSENVISTLPDDEVLLLNRVLSIAAHSAWKLGMTKPALNYFHKVLHRWPTALRILSIPIPAKITADSNELSQQIAKKLDDSPRLTRDKGHAAFQVRVVKKGTYSQICLNGPTGQRYDCSVVDLSKNKDTKELVSTAIDMFHNQVFSPKIDLTQQDINSLDGSTIRGRADDVLKQVFTR